MYLLVKSYDVLSQLCVELLSVDAGSGDRSLIARTWVPLDALDRDDVGSQSECVGEALFEIAAILARDPEFFRSALKAGSSYV
jgi:hypothetical protein